MAGGNRGDLNATSYALLGLLSFGRELSGYELKRWADGSVRFFYAAPAMSQVYRELDRLAGAGLVASREVAGGATRRTRVHRITDAGTAALRAWLDHQPAGPPVLKHGVALRVFLGHLADRERLLATVDDHRRRCEELVADLDGVLADLGDDPTWRYPRLVAEWGRAYYGGEAEAAARLASALAAMDDDGAVEEGGAGGAAVEERGAAGGAAVEEGGAGTGGPSPEGADRGGGPSAG